MSLMETYLVVTCPSKGCNLHVETRSEGSELSNLPNSNRQALSEGRSTESGIDNVVKQLDFWHSKIDH